MAAFCSSLAILIKLCPVCITLPPALVFILPDNLTKKIEKNKSISNMEIFENKHALKTC